MTMRLGQTDDGWLGHVAASGDGRTPAALVEKMHATGMVPVGDNEAIAISRSLFEAGWEYSGQNHVQPIMKTGILLGLALVLSSGLVGCSMAKPHSDAANPLSLSIALLDSPNSPEIYVSINTNCHFHIVITNYSKQPQNLLQEGSSWGWETMSFELTDENGHKYLIHRTPAGWTDNAPVYWILKPGEHYVRDICFAQIYQGRNSWIGFPEQLTNGGNLKVKMKAIFEVDINKGFDGAPLWHGRIESQPITCTFFDNRSRIIYPSPYGE